MLLLIKILFTIFVICMCICFIKDTLIYINKKKYWKVILGIFLISYFIYSGYKVLIL